MRCSLRWVSPAPCIFLIIRIYNSDKVCPVQWSSGFISVNNCRGCRILPTDCRVFSPLLSNKTNICVCVSIYIYINFTHKPSLWAQPTHHLGWVQTSHQEDVTLPVASAASKSCTSSFVTFVRLHLITGRYYIFHFDLFCVKVYFWCGTV